MMQTMTINFVETMRGYGTAMVTQTSDASAQAATAVALASAHTQMEDGRLVDQILAQALREGHAFPLVLRQIAVSVDTAVFTDESGLRGSIQAGIVEAPGLDEQALLIQRGEFELLSEAGRGERRMRYRLYCSTPNGQRGFLIHGFKHIANQSGKPLPLAIWRETTMLYMSVYALAAPGEDTLAEPPGQPIAIGIIRIRWADFARQLLTFRSRGAPGLPGHVRNIWAFVRFFVAALASVYLRGNQ
jgi:hypothetical protein